MVTRRAVLAALSAFVLLAGAVLVGAQVYPTRYESRAVVGFLPRNPTATGADTMSLIVPKYVALLENAQVRRRLAANLEESPGYLRGAVSAVIEPSTVNLDIDATADDPARAARIANAFAATVVDEASDDRLIAADVVAPAVPASAPALPTRSQLMLVGVVLALAAALVVAVAVQRWGRPASLALAVPDWP